MANLIRSPHRAGTDDDSDPLGDDTQEQIVVYPKQRLGAVTRIKHCIEELLQQFPSSVNEVSALVEKLNLKIVVFRELCEEELQKNLSEADKEKFTKWFDEHYAQMYSFYVAMKSKITSHFEKSDVDSLCAVSVRDSASNAGSGRSSVGSHLSAAKLKIAEKKAAIVARKKLAEKTRALKEQQLKLRLELEELDLFKDEEECKFIEEAVQEMENENESQSNRRLLPSPASSDQCSKVDAGLAQVLAKQNEISLSLVKAQQRSLLPNRAPEVFSGEDVTQYTTFKIAFEQIVKNNCDDNSSQYYYLCQFTSGHARQLVTSCNCSNPGVAFDRAIELLERKYGNSYVRSHAHLKRIDEWPKISNGDARGFEEFSLYLTSIANMMPGFDELGQLNNHKEMKMIIDKFPFDVVKTWRAHVCMIQDRGEAVVFSYLEKFISQQSRIVNLPVFGDLKASSASDSAQLGARAKNRRAFPTSIIEEANSTGESSPLCPCCKKDGHNLDNCYFFKGKIYEEKVRFVKEKNLCFACLEPGHRSASCKSRVKCKECFKSHPTSLHKAQGTFVSSNFPERDVKTQQEPEDLPLASYPATCVTTSQRPKVRGGRVVSAAVPVLVSLPGGNQCIKTYMALDSWATDSFMSTELREKYWIVKGTSLAKKIARECIICRKINGRTGRAHMSDLPTDRVSGDHPPFHAVGLDYFGPFLVTKGRGRSVEKRYGVVFTCLASRAVHLEVAFSLDTDAFINVLRRFMSRRGPVTRIYSDNGTNFVGGLRELREAQEAWNKNCIHSLMHQRNIEWKFHPPAASHFGGAWEREIRTARKILNSLISEQHRNLTDDLLNTLFCEVESILNNRPLTYLSTDPKDVRPLTPNHLLMLHAVPGSLPPGQFTTDDDYARRRWKYVQHMADVFWQRWRKEYLRLLQHRRRWSGNYENFAVDDLVLIVDSSLPRNQWSVGRITEVLKSSDGRVRAAKVGTSKCDAGRIPSISCSEVVRPIVKLINLTN